MPNHHLTRVALIAVVFLLIGEGCIFGQTTGPANNAQLPPGTLLTQGPPPADCGQRNPNKLQAHFTIPDTDVYRGDPITIDASCTVGRVASLQWDFDFEAWPASTPGDQRLQPPITISHADLRSPSSGQPAGGWPINNLSPFFQAYTPQALGTHTARLLVTDQAGNQQLVIHTYNVTQTGQRQRQSATSPHRPYFVLYNAKTEAGDSIAVPRQETRTMIPFYTSLPFFNAYAFGASGDIETFEWTIRRHGTLSGVVGTETDRRDPRRFPGIDFVVSRNTNDGLQIIDNVIPQADLDRGFGDLAMINTFDPRPRQETEETIDFSIELRTTSQVGDSKTFSERYTLIDASTVKTLRPQLALIPGSPQTILQTGGQLDAWQSSSVAYELDPGQTFWLENYSVYPVSKRHTIPNAGQLWNQQNPRRSPRPSNESGSGQITGQIIIEMDPGTGVYNEVGRMQSFVVIQEYKTTDSVFDISSFYRNANYFIPYTAPMQPGVYTARLRLTQSEVPGFLAAQQAETSIKFRVREPPAPAVPLPPAPPTAQSAPIPQAPVTPAPTAPAGVRAEVNPISQTGQVLSAPIHPDDILQFLARGVSVATMQRVEWDFDGDGVIDETCNVTEPYAGAGLATCQSSAKAPPQAQGNHTARLTIVPKTGAPYNVTVQYNVVPDDRAAASAALPIPSISPELYAENKNGVRMRSNPEIYQNDSIIFLLNGLTEVAKKVQYDFENDGTYDVNCDVRQNQGQLQCLLYRRVSWRTAPGDYVARIKVMFAGSAGQLDFVLPYSVVRGERPADRQS